MINVDKIVANIKKQISDKKCSVAIIIGNSFSDIVDEIQDKVIINFKDIDGLKVMGTDIEENKLIFGKYHEKDVVVALGRIHYSLGYEPEDVSTLIFVFKELGCEKLILTTSVGAISKKIKVGDIVTFNDQINFTSRNPLSGKTYDKYGQKFFDMIEPFDEEMQDILTTTAKKEMAIKIKKAVVMEFPGPNAETISESKIAYLLGADVVAFNICCEVISAKYCGLPVVGYGLVTNYASAYTNSKIKHEDIVYNRKCASNYYLELLGRLVENL